MGQVPNMDRHQWAVACMAIHPSDRLLEIGCGTGPAIASLCKKLTSGHLLAIDRSAGMIQKARIKNKDQLDSGKLVLRLGALSDLDWGEESFDKVYSFNVNVFWMKPAADLAVLRQLLGPKSQAFFFYSPPDRAQLQKIMLRLPQMLDMHGFRVQKTFEARFGSTRAFGLRADDKKHRA